MRSTHIVCTAALVVSAPIAAWWAIGDLSEEVHPDLATYVVSPPNLDSPVELALGAGATTTLLGAVVVLALATRRGAVASHWWSVVTPLVALGVVGATSYRILTAAVHGANIGAGMVMLIAPLVVVGLLVTSFLGWRSGAQTRISAGRTRR